MHRVSTGLARRFGTCKQPWAKSWAHEPEIDSGGEHPSSNNIEVNARTTALNWREGTYLEIAAATTPSALIPVEQATNHSASSTSSLGSRSNEYGSDPDICNKATSDARLTGSNDDSCFENTHSQQ